MPDPTTPTCPPLSPAAQAVLDACNRAIDREATCLAFDPFREPLTRDIAAAALRALTSSNVVSVYQDEINCDVEHVCVNDILAIAAELEATP